VLALVPEPGLAQVPEPEPGLARVLEPVPVPVPGLVRACPTPAERIHRRRRHNRPGWRLTKHKSASAR